MNVTIRNPPGTRLVPLTASLLIVIALVAVTGCGDQKQQADGLVRAAIEQSKADRHADALQLLGRAVALDPGLAEAFYLRGACFTKLHQTPQAVEEFSAATRLKPEWDEAWCALGIAQLTAGETEQGIESLSKALNLNPEMLSAWEARARGYRDLHLTEDELSDIEGLLQLDPVNCNALLRRGTLLSETDPALATEDFSKVISRDRTNATAWMQRGLCYNRSGDTDRALADLNIACRLQPDNFQPWLERGRILRSLNRLDDAISDLSKAVELAPNDVSTRLELGQAYLANSDPDAAEANLLEAERLSPENGDVREAMAQTDITRGHREEAPERVAELLAEQSTSSPLLTEATEITPAELPEETIAAPETLVHAEPVPVVEPGNFDAPQIRSALLAKSDRRKEAIEDQTRLISSGVGVKPNAAAQSVLNRGRLHLDGKEWTAATEDFSTYLEVCPDDAEALALRARAWLAQKETSHAITDLTLALLKKPDAADLYTLRAESFDQFNEPAAALADLQKAASLQPTRLDVQQKLAERLFQDRQFAKCAKALDALAASNAGQLSAEQRLLRGRARLADGNLNGAHEDASALAADESSSPGAVKSTDVALLQIMIALRRHDDVEALRLVKLIPEETLTPDVLLLYGQTLARQNLPDEAIRIFSNLLESDPSNTAALLARATVFVDTADWQAASNDADLVLQNLPDDPRALQIKAISLFQNDRFREALETLEHSALLSRDTNDSRWMRIQCCDELEMTFRELEELNALLGIAPTHEAARLLRAELLEELGHFDDAIADLSAVLQHDPVNLVALRDRGLLNQRRGNADAAVVDFTKAIELSPDDAELYYRRGIARHSTGQNDEAQQDLDHALELNPDLADAWYVIGNIEAGRGKPDVAVAAFAKAVEIKPEHAAAWYNRGNLLFSQSKMQQAIDCWTIAINIQPGLFRAYNNRAAAYDRLNQDTEALADYEKTLELNPGFVRAWDSLAWLLATSDNQKVRDAKRAVSLATKACELSEFKDWSCLNTLATCHAENQEFDAALKWAKQARAIAPEADRKELDQLVATYESRLKSKRMSVKPAGSVR
ncbi:MAG: tetratricopeptide repeat protein, partial [Fuerstia sp.]|nr:tetratricopeptide repeat protein [Fuerstiella sp.]